MLLNTYKDAGKLYYSNFLEQTSEAALSAYRGDLVIEAGELDDMGHAKPPKSIVHEVLLVADDKLHMFVGLIDKMENLPKMIDAYKADFAPDMLALVYVVNLSKSVQVDVDGFHFTLIPMVQGVPWNETLEELALEKSHFKGQKPGDKLLTLMQEMKDYKPKYETVPLDIALGMTNTAVREVHGAV